MSLISNIKAEITAIETYLLAYLPVDHHDQIRRAIAVAHARVDEHVTSADPWVADAALSDPVDRGVALQTHTGESAVPEEPAPVQGELLPAEPATDATTTDPVPSAPPASEPTPSV